MSGKDLYEMYLTNNRDRGLYDFDEWYELTSREKDVWNALADDVRRMLS